MSTSTVLETQTLFNKHIIFFNCAIGSTHFVRAADHELQHRNRHNTHAEKGGPIKPQSRVAAGNRKVFPSSRSMWHVRPFVCFFNCFSGEANPIRNLGTVARYLVTNRANGLGNTNVFLRPFATSIFSSIWLSPLHAILVHRTYIAAAMLARKREGRELAVPQEHPVRHDIYTYVYVSVTVFTSPTALRLGGKHNTRRAAIDMASSSQQAQVQGRPKRKLPMFDRATEMAQSPFSHHTALNAALHVHLRDTERRGYRVRPN
ncbi:hypothetical protein TPHA_0J03230 [Tetrapisispora phaffii CBS 4417]|uniref:Uncharacterized protein n=1 Tax=Tetrapisispora phaffii (strain ATCC 24235 / CBS 4417 / NBRC 1672 / NRRL Y-8282 / UCD 70-5) TaxID=1071381 RepID=G8BY91_TETPH|nr:hypothetical protein TPHA_0J03230 [Tetrapisispora phaffii CBS 4417]CCE65142.1 hypothetical protein TPHA_0J03230 [Tetrapisispora phaffii CBS 4417]